MFWVVLAIVIIVAWVIYSKRKGSVTLSKDQAQLVHQLVGKELKELATKMYGMVDEAALQGKTVSVDSICKNTADMTEDVRQGVEEYKRALLEKYGPTIPINTVHRISLELEGNGQMWSDKSGCFERHLQRRDGNLLFPKERRIVTQREIEEAKQKDIVEQRQLTEKVRSFALESTTALKNDVSIDQAVAVLKEVQALLAEAASIGGDIDNAVQVLERTEAGLMESMNMTMPEGAEQLKLLHSYSVTERLPYFAQFMRKDSPIRKEEEIPTLLTEDSETISFEGYKSNAFGPDYRPNEAAIRTHLEKAVDEGFSKERAAQIADAWNEGRLRWSKDST
jgi:hypothetical protein